MSPDSRDVFDRLLQVRTATMRLFRKHRRDIRCECSEDDGGEDCLACRVWNLLELPAHAGPAPRAKR